MKIKGQPIEPPKDSIVVIPRVGSDDIVIRACAVLDFTEFEAICKEPEVPVKQTFGSNGAIEPFPEEPTYKAALDTYLTNRQNWMFIQSLKPTEIEWETIDEQDPETWGNWATELTDAGFSNLELMKILETITVANGLNQERIEEATKSFLAIAEQDSQQ